MRVLHCFFRIAVRVRAGLAMARLVNFFLLIRLRK
jgi:hypothetical protein